MTATLMGRLFVVPALVVCVLLGVAVVVVLFGSSSIEKPETMQDLLSRIEVDTGDKAGGMLLFPAAKETWQAAQELARRLEQKEKYLAPEDVEPLARRIITILDESRQAGGEGQGSRDQERGHARKLFLLTALGRLETPSAVEPLAGFLEDSDAKTRQFALRALADMASVPEARKAVGKVYPLLNDPDPAVQIVASLVVAALADRGDPIAIRGVAEKLESDPEIRWNAAMALARLGSKRGKLVLMNMLDRPFWEGRGGELDYEETGGTRIRRRLTEAEIEARLCAGIKSAAFLDDLDLRDLIVKLSRDDKSHVVREAARAALEAMVKKSDEQAFEAAPDLLGRTG